MSSPSAVHPALASPSPWLLRWQHLLKPGGQVLDVACGSGRHVRHLADAGFKLTALDRDAAAVEPLRQYAELCVADIENGPWPLPGRLFDAVLVTNYLWRPLWPQLLASLAPGGVLIYETFAAGQETVGRPSRAEFLLQPGELLTLCGPLRTVAFEDGFMSQPERFVQRVVAVAPTANTSAAPVRHPLQPQNAA